MIQEEFMVNDWVIFHDSGYASDGTTWKEDRVCQIEGIFGCVTVKWTDEDGEEEDWPHISPSDLSPIPLTKDILEKNGFEEDYDDGFDDMFICKNNDYTIEIDFTYIPSPDNTLSKVISLNVENIISVVIEHVHQLQHALMLCGIDKKITL